MKTGNITINKEALGQTDGGKICHQWAALAEMGLSALKGAGVLEKNGHSESNKGTKHATLGKTKSTWGSRTSAKKLYCIRKGETLNK